MVLFHELSAMETQHKRPGHHIKDGDLSVTVVDAAPEERQASFIAEQGVNGETSNGDGVRTDYE